MAQNGHSNGFFHGFHSSNPVTANSAPNGSTMDQDGIESEESSSLDHALLESLFYNEMMMLNPASPTSSNFLAQQFNEATSNHPSTLPNRFYIPASDPNTIAEKEMLQDFGVTGSTHLLTPTRTITTDSWIPHPTTGDTTATALQSQATYSGPSQSSHTAIYPAPEPQSHQHHQQQLYPVAMASNPVLHHLPPPSTQASPVSAGIVKARPSLSIDPQTSLLTDERARKLVDQFATLASRLGIELPSCVLQSLTAAAAKNDPQMIQTQVRTSKCGKSEALPSSESCTLSIHHQGEPSVDQDEPALVVAPTVEELRKTAEEAIAAVTKKRPQEQAEFVENTKDPNDKNRPLYSKRRKKPRLADCESRLAELQAENEMLKRHLQNVSNKAHRFEQEKQEAGKRIRRLWETNAGPEETDKAVLEFQHMYSDYGSNRQQELSFHLEQLQRLVNPTNFTKLGLWTLGQNGSNPKRNPIAGILQKELDITPQQGRKILDQSEKIRVLCDNLKESLALLAKLKSLCELKTKIFNDRMNKCREILTSKQVVRLILWIDEHTQLLEKVCPGWGTEYIHPPSKNASSTNNSS